MTEAVLSILPSWILFTFILDMDIVCTYSSHWVPIRQLVSK
jgi:hypothetical protein